MKKEKEKDKENHEGDVSYNPKRNSEKIQQEEERSIDIESNNQEEEEKEVKEKIIDRMIDRNTSSKPEQGTNKNSVLRSIDDRTIYDLQTLLSQRHDRLESAFYKRYQYNTSIKRGQDFFLNHVDSKLSLVVMYADL